MTYTPFDLSGKVALITGGNRGIGLGMAKALAQAGADICLWGRDEERNTAAVESLKIHGTRVSAQVCDVADDSQVVDRMGDCLTEFGRIDGCFANAGVLGGARSFFDISTDDWHQVLGVNLDGAFFTLKAAAAHMKERAESGDPGGRLIVTSSLASISGAARNEHYAATKGGVSAMMKALSVELARYRVTANAILPGWIETDMTETAMSNEKFAGNVMPRIPVRRWGQPEDFGGIAIYLMSDASSYHTGDEILIDGGYFLF
ncbi:MAG: 2-deoxy-D-gluconate 3-dehydrogenase [Alphaproteobacteria bacterium]|nr:2-deoxy-D-gluconate 3-dehydrogenase [Alphaproteobacteria bacterium]